ncbi:rhamnogalacturonan lyase B N-terminal domain-containing protein [Clostridium sp. JS66]|uniref:rhamnogalacturonan lyase B N-terminal domain-containing protein n=1 Tax=Clostridium sp. JS66 TaxID=3064705 RepID=UPI00298DEFDC|nr:rhamnogalacturonan lyase B N-terminal domain-containing protein [Clostridium sp. JS66]WPC43993.1 rhamnogalacturonan lyase B N-terminal domain-containing protein [Clostridium sp. JS66]
MEHKLKRISLCWLISIIIITSFIITSVILAEAKTSHLIEVLDNGSNIVVNTGAGLVYTIDKKNGDMTSCKLNGTELNSQKKKSQINSGLGVSNVTWSKFSSNTEVLITVKQAALTHYYASRSKDNTIYMATYISKEPSDGLLRYIFRGNGNVLTNVPAESNNKGAVGLEGRPDVFIHLDKTITSKYYGNDQAKDLSIRGCTGKGVGVFMAYGSRETSIGGPFFRDIQFQSGDDTEIYNVMNHAEGKTEPFRMGLYGPYALCFTTGSKPSIPDFNWMSSLKLQGWVSNRGSVEIKGLSGMDRRYKYMYSFSNDTAQYWNDTSTTGYGKCDNMKPGIYTMLVYKGELAVYKDTVKVEPYKTTSLNSLTITKDPSNIPVIWRIGNWDGTPLEFLNGKNISKMHPSDIRNSSWGPVIYTIGSDAENEFPAAQFSAANNPTTINFNLTSDQAKEAHSLNIGITTAYSSGRPDVTINGNKLPSKSPSTEPSSRTLTVGTYRGNNTTFTWKIPASYFKTGKNTITIASIGGKAALSTYLSPAYSYDCIELAE